MGRSFSVTDLVSELRRRRVWRVLAAYVVAAWIAIEVADTIFPNLGLPRWSVTMVIVMAALGLPVALVLAWAFDITPEGVRRTLAADASAQEVSRFANASARSILYIVAAVALLGTGWMVWSGAKGDAGLNMEQVAVMPLRTSGASPDVAYLREGLPDLLTASLAASGGVYTGVSTRSIGLALDRRGLRDADVTDQDGRAVAGDLGAGLTLLGELIGDADHVVVSASLVDVRSGRARAALRVEASPDSLHRLTDGLINQLVAVMGGTLQGRLAAVTSTSREALEAYIRGAAAHRRANYEESVIQLDRAVSIDSTFAMAALWLYDAGVATSLRTANFDRAIRLAWHGRHQLGPADRSYLEAIVGPHYPTPTPFAELIAFREHVARSGPDRAELLYLAGDAYLHYGALVGYTDALERAADYFERGFAIDSTYAGVVEHASQLALRQGDMAAMRRYSDILIGLDSIGWSVELERWLRARVLGVGYADSMTTILERVGPEIAESAAWNAVMIEVGIPEIADAVYATLERTTGSPRRRVLLAARHMALLEGRPSLVDRLALELHKTDFDLWQLWHATMLRGDSALAESVLPRIERDVHGMEEGARTYAALTAGMWLARTGRIERAQAMRALLAPDSTISPADARERHISDRLLAAQIAHAQRSPEAAALLNVIDDMMRAGHRASRRTRNDANTHLGRIWEERGEYRLALDAYRRREEFAVDYTLVERFAAEGRMAELLGDRTAAINAYRRYLQFRTRPEGIFATRTDEVRRRLAALLGEGHEVQVSAPNGTP